MTIFLSQQFIQVLAEASDGKIPTDLVFLVIGLQLPGLASLILPISLFLGILLAHGRLYSDNEMSVLHACGVSEWYITRTTLVFALAVSLFTALLTLWWGPAALSQEHQIAEKARTETGVSVIQTGRFQQVASQRAVVFVENQTDQQELENIFVAQMPSKQMSRNEIVGDEERASVVMARKGNIVSLESGAQLLSLQDGRR